jgi:hypothetical protein
MTPQDLLEHRQRRTVRDARLVTALTVLSAVIAAFCLVLALQVSQYSRHAAAQPPAPPEECREGEAPSRCPAGEFCQAGVCTTPGSSARCEPGALCASCDCDAPLTCDPQGICGLPRAAGVCSDADVLSFLKLLQEKCGNVRNCESKDLDKHAIAYPDFLELIGRFPDTLAIHFPDGQPGPSADPAWPSTAESEHYINRLRTALVELEGRRAHRPGRARQPRPPHSRSRGQQGDHPPPPDLRPEPHLPRCRSRVSAPRADALEGKISIIQVGDKRSLDARQYAGQYGNRPITWSAEAERQLRFLVEEGDAVGTLDDIRWRDRTLNQVVFVVPIPCKIAGGA